MCRPTTRGFQRSYRRWRPMVERSIAWLGRRRLPTAASPATTSGGRCGVAAVNLRRLLMLGLAHHDHAWMLA